MNILQTYNNGDGKRDLEVATTVGLLIVHSAKQNALYGAGFQDAETFMSTQAEKR